MDNPETENHQKVSDMPWRFQPGKSGNPNGRPKLTEEEKEQKRIMRKVTENLIEEYRSLLGGSLPEVGDALIVQAKKGNIPAIREIHEVVGAHKAKNTTIIPIQININEAREEFE